MSSHLAAAPDGWEKISLCLAHCWRLVSWSDTRWVRAGRSARMYLMSLATGIEGEVTLCIEDPLISNYHLQCHLKSTPEIKLWSGICSA